MMAAVVVSPTSRDDTEIAGAVSANPSPVCSGAYCTVTFTFTGDYYAWTAPTTGTYDLKVWGAQGGNDGTYPTQFFGGRGGYSAGTVSLTAGTVLYVYVGQQGGRNTVSCSSSWGSTGGGGGTDIRLVSGVWNNSTSLLSRIIVAGGGGGRHGGNFENGVWLGNDGGGLTAPSYVHTTHGNYTATGGSQTAGGTSNYYTAQQYGVSGSFGFANANVGSNTCSYGGWNGGARGSDGFANGGGGGGWYGGATSWPTSSGGSGYVLTASSHKPAGYSPTSAYHLSNTEVLNGGQSVPNPNPSLANTTGRIGDGIATIKYLNVPSPAITASVGSLTNQSSTITYTVNYSESVTGIDISDFQLSGTSTGWSLSSLTGSGSGPYTITVTGSSVASGTVILTQLQNSVFGNSTQQNGPAADTAASTITVDVDRPTASVTSAPSSPAAGMTQTFGLSFSESVSGIAAGDFSNAGTALGCVFTPSAASGTSVNVVVTQCQEGTLQLQLAANAVSDAATNTGPVAALTSSVITLQASALTVTAGAKSINYGGLWTDSYTQSGLIGSDSISSVSYSYSGTTTLGTPYGPSGTKPTAGGTYTITPSAVLNAGNANRYAVTHVSAALTISRVAQSALTISTTTGTYGSTLLLATSGGSGTGAVTYSVASGSCTVSGAVLTLGDAGSSCSVTATKAADDNYTQVSSAATSISTAKAAQSVLTISTTTATYGQDLVLGVSGGSGSGSVSYQVVSGTCSIVGALLTPGNAGSSCVIKATKATDTNYLERSSSNTTITINKAQQSGLNITSSLSFTTGNSLTLTASGGQSTGSLSWSLNSGTCSLSGVVLTANRGGISCVIEVTRAGDTNYLSSSVTETVVVDKIVQVLTFQSTPPSSPVVGGTYTVQVTSDASLAPIISISNQSASVCSISAGVVTFNTAGTCVISAVQSGNDVYAAAAASQSITVSVVPTTTTTVAPIPQSAVPAPASTSSTTTTTTTTTIPADAGSPNLGSDGEPPQLEAGEATATVRGKRVQIETSVEQGRLVMTLPGNVVMRIGSTDSSSGAQIGADGVLRMFGDSSVEVIATGLVAQTIYTVYMFSDAVELGRGETDGKGALSQVITVPKDAEAGEHTLQINGVGKGNEVVSVSMGFEIVERESNTRIAVLVITLAIALALLGGRPIFRRRRRA
jgi:trimeric autotransporter adhesin